MSLKITACGGGRRRDYGRLVPEVVNALPGFIPTDKARITETIQKCAGGRRQPEGKVDDGGRRVHPRECGCVYVHVCVDGLALRAVENKIRQEKIMQGLER